uniref:DUF2088 domain-containing protein n=1 Tax=Parastrongyloides trichosuri TaxID=131310 RepID=A0A0N4Z4Y6_PARTI
MSKSVSSYKQRVVIFTDETCGGVPLLTIRAFMEILYNNLRERGFEFTEREDTIIIRPYSKELENTFKNMKSENVALAIFIYLPQFKYLEESVKDMGKQFMMVTKTLKYVDIVRFIQTQKNKIIKSMVSSVSNKMRKNASYFI